MPHDQLLVPLEWDRIGRGPGAANGVASGATSGAASGTAGNLLGQIEIQGPFVKMLHDRCVYGGRLWIGGAECEDHCLRGV